jgi:hypothetical protein
MSTNDDGNTAGEAIGPRDSNAGRVAGAVGDLSRSAIATIWGGQKQLRQRVLTANAPGASFRNNTGSASRGKQPRVLVGSYSPHHTRAEHDVRVTGRKAGGNRGGSNGCEAYLN